MGSEYGERDRREPADSIARAFRVVARPTIVDVSNCFVVASAWTLDEFSLQVVGDASGRPTGQIDLAGR